MVLLMVVASKFMERCHGGGTGGGYGGVEHMSLSHAQFDHGELDSHVCFSRTNSTMANLMSIVVLRNA